MATIDVGDKHSILMEGLSGFWQRFFKDVKDLEAFYQASEVYLGQAYLDLLAGILNIGIVDTPVFNKEAWKLLTILETDLNFREGATSDLNRYVYSLPNSFTSLNELQNTIFGPSIVLEKDLDFESTEGSSEIAFTFDPFRTDAYEGGILGPLKGVAWRNVTKAVGNAFWDTYLRSKEVLVNYFDLGVQRGDTLRILATCKVVLAEGLAGTVIVSGGIATFHGGGVGAAGCSTGDVVEVYSHSGSSNSDVFITKMIVASVDPLLPNQVVIDNTCVGCPINSSSGVTLSWRLWKSDYSRSQASDYEIDYIEEATQSLVGHSDFPFPVGLDSPIVYAVVRTPEDNAVFSFFVFFATDFGDLPISSSLGVTDIDVGSVYVNARKSSDVTKPVVEGEDYSVDYTRGVLIQKKPWHSNSRGAVDFTHKKRVITSAGGQSYARSVGTVKQLSFWTSSVEVDRFTLWYNYGTLLNRFGTSSDAYKSLLRGIMHLYVSGPILERIESALNLAVGLPVVRTEGEILRSYFNGQDALGTNASIDDTSNTVSIPWGDYRFTDLDLGAKLILTDVVNAVNTGTFTIVSLDFMTNTARIESDYPLLTTTGVSWILSRMHMQQVVTSGGEYLLPYTAPMRSDITDASNFNSLTLAAFETLTTAFTVTDYVEDPQWWHNQHIPEILWNETSMARRMASVKLYAHVLGAEDEPRLGDPGLYLGADEEGNILNPVDGEGNAVPIYRHNAAFVIFDRYLKMHTFFVGIDGALELDAQFQNDLNDLVLIAKPSYAYPYVVPSERFTDPITLTDIFWLAGATLGFGGDGDDHSDSLHIGGGALVLGDTRFPLNGGDFFRYGTAEGIAVPGAPAVPITVGTLVDLGTALPANSRYLTLNINGTAGGLPLLEGRDYVVNWRIMQEDGSPHLTPWRLRALTDWDGGTFPSISFTRVTITPIDAYDTLSGDTPLHLGGYNPCYIRHTALDPEAVAYPVEWEALRSEHLDRPLQITIDDGGLSYTY